MTLCGPRLFFRILLLANQGMFLRLSGFEALKRSYFIPRISILVFAEMAPTLILLPLIYIL